MSYTVITEDAQFATTIRLSFASNLMGCELSPRIDIHQHLKDNVLTWLWPMVDDVEIIIAPWSEVFNIFTQKQLENIVVAVPLALSST